MTIRVFISYRRRSSTILANLLKGKFEDQGIEAYMDVEGKNVPGKFMPRTLNEIEKADVFLCVLNNDTLQSDFVLQEIQHAVEKGKPLIPVFHEGWEDTPFTGDSRYSKAVAELTASNGVVYQDKTNRFTEEAVANIIALVRNAAPQTTSPKPQNLQRGSSSLV
ncbi:MAG: toll/interleukin-1 receptor domain-containing protein, partial [Armatimonadetes bacterium]|nr:toll/interleukin-1 receptor domain-containing protein [Anaerolineae bacterium]